MIIAWGCGPLFLPVASQAAHLTPTPALHRFLWLCSVCQRGTNSVTGLWVFSLFPFRSNVCGVAAHAVLLKDQCHWGCSVAGRCGFVGNGLTVVANCCGYFCTIFCWRAPLSPPETHIWLCQLLSNLKIWLVCNNYESDLRMGDIEDEPKGEL